MFLTTEQRREGIGGSDVGSIMGANPYRSPIACYKDKLGEMPPIEVNHAMEWGNLLEDVVGMKYADSNNIKFHGNIDPIVHPPDWPVTNNGIMYKPDTMRSTKHNWAYAHPDFYIFSPEGYTGIEIKTVGDGIYKKYWAEGEIPPWQYYQVVWYSMVTKINKWTMVGFAPHLRLSKDPMLVHEIEIDLDTQMKVWERVEYFWDCVQSKTIPELPSYNEQDLKLLYPESTGDMVTSTKYIDKVARNLFTVREQIKPLLEKEDEYKNEIKAYMQNCSRLIGEHGGELATYKSPKARVTIDYKGIATDFKKKLGPEAYGTVEDSNTKAVIPARRFLLKYKEDV